MGRESGARRFKTVLMKGYYFGQLKRCGEREELDFHRSHTHTHASTNFHAAHLRSNVTSLISAEGKTWSNRRWQPWRETFRRASGTTSCSILLASPLRLKVKPRPPPPGANTDSNTGGQIKGAFPRQFHWPCSNM